ncbi:hypothetical protein TURU_002358 [Turdus rufiventris]|nr:hypothetical protein TURU_002358 [Turdus rufiventris]
MENFYQAFYSPYLYQSQHRENKILKLTIDTPLRVDLTYDLRDSVHAPHWSGDICPAALTSRAATISPIQAIPEPRAVIVSQVSAPLVAFLGVATWSKKRHGDPSLGHSVHQLTDTNVVDGKWRLLKGYRGFYNLGSQRSFLLLMSGWVRPDAEQGALSFDCRGKGALSNHTARYLPYAYP